MLKKCGILLGLFLGPVLSQAALSGSTTAGETVIDGVPGFAWHHGCDPTAAGMVIAYWDMHGYSKLIPGDSTTQTAAVDLAIASNEHVQDYALPIDDSSTGVLEDQSSLDGGHANNCLADFMGTSRSKSKLLHGWTKSEIIEDALLAYTLYVNVQNSVGYEAISELYYHNTTFSFDVYKNQIDQNHPMIFVVDSDGDGEGDHGVTAVGYRETNGYPEYACWDTRDTENLRWERFQSIDSGNKWGIYLAFSYEIVSAPEEPVEPVEPEEPDDPDDDDDLPSAGCTPFGMIVLLTIFAGFGFVSTERKS